VLANGFAGDEALAVRHVETRNGSLFNTDFYLVVRQGALLGALWLSDQRWTLAELVALGKRLAARLCAAAATC